MKKALFILTLLISQFVIAQEEDDSYDFSALSLKIRHTEGQSNVSLLAGFNETGKNLGFEYGYYVHKKINLLAQINYEFGSVGQTKYQTIFVPLKVEYSFANTREIFFYNIFVGGIIGGEYIKNPIQEGTISNFRYGINFGANTEIFLINKLAIIPEFIQFYEIESELGKWHYQINLKLRYLIN